MESHKIDPYKIFTMIAQTVFAGAFYGVYIYFIVKQIEKPEIELPLSLGTIVMGLMSFFYGKKIFKEIKKNGRVR